MNKHTSVIIDIESKMNLPERAELQNLSRLNKDLSLLKYTSDEVARSDISRGKLFDNVADKFSDLADGIEEMQSKLSVYDRLDNKLSSLDQSISDNQKIVGNISSYKSLESQIESLASEHDHLSKVNDANVASMRNSKNQVKSLEAEINSHKNTLGELIVAQSQAGDSGADYSKDIKLQQQMIKGLEKDLTKANKQHKELIKTQTLSQKAFYLSDNKLADYRYSLTKLGTSLRSAGVNTNSLTDASEEAERAIKKLKMRANDYKRVLDGLGKIKHMGINADALKHASMGAGIAGGVLAGGVAFGMETTAERARIAKSYKTSFEDYDAMHTMAVGAGMNGEHAGDLLEEIANKVGEMEGLGEQTALTEGLEMLGLEFDQIQGKNALEQYLILTDAAEKMGNNQQAQSAMDMITGGEGNKFVSYAQSEGKSTRQMVAESRGKNLLDNESAERVTQLSDAIHQMSKTSLDGMALISGEIGRNFTPQITQLSSGVTRLFRENKAEIGEFVTEISNSIKSTASFVYENRELILTGGKVLAYMTAFSAGTSIVKFALSGVTTTLQVASGAISFCSSAYRLLASSSVLAAGKTAVVNTAMLASRGVMMASSAATTIASGAMAGFNAVCMANPIGLVVTGIGAAIAAGVALYYNWDKVTSFMGTAFDYVGDKCGSVFNWIGSKSDEVTSWIGDKFTWVSDKISALLDYPMQKIQGMFSYISEIGNQISSFFSDDETTQKIVTTFSEPVSAGVNFTSNAIDAASKFIGSSYESISKVASNPSDWIEGKLDGAQDHITKLIESMSDSFSGMEGNTESLLDKLAKYFQESDSKISELFKPINTPEVNKPSGTGTSSTDYEYVLASDTKASIFSNQYKHETAKSVVQQYKEKKQEVESIKTAPKVINSSPSITIQVNANEAPTESTLAQIQRAVDEALSNHANQLTGALYD